MTIDASGYSLSGNKVELTQGVSATFNSNSSDDSIDTQLDGGSVSVAGGGQLNLSGVLSGTAGLNFTGAGTLNPDGSSANTYSGTTTVAQGTLNVAVSGALGSGTVDIENPATLQIDGTNGNVTLANNITYNSSANAILSLAGSNTISGNQLASNAGVTVANSQATLDLNGQTDAINDLTVTKGLVSLPAGSSLTADALMMTGGDINMGTGSPFTLAGDATINNSASGSSIDGSGTMSVTGTPIITVNTTTPAVGTARLVVTRKAVRSGPLTVHFSRPP
jgi:fibronectin-binding autotransporter adhesin